MVKFSASNICSAPGVRPLICMCNFYGPNAAAVTVAPAAGETGIDIVYPDIQTSEPATMASMYTLETSTPQYDNAECVSCYLHD